MSKDTLTWFQINNWIPILSAIVVTVLSYGVLMSRVAVLENKMDLVLENQEKILAKYSGVEERYGKISLQVAKLEALVLK